MFSQKSFRKQSFISTSFAIATSVAAVAGFVYAATTIGTNISVDGNLVVSGTTATSTFSTGGLTVDTSKFVVQQTSGNVGIGTTTPFGLLSVNPTNVIGANPQFVVGSSTQTSFVIANSGNINIGAAIQPSFTFAKVYINNSNASNNLTDAGLVIEDRSTNSAGASLTLSQDWGGNGNGTQVYYAGSGSANTNIVNIPKSAVWQGDQGGIVLQVSSGPIIFATGGIAFSNETMRISASGNIGIGTTTPYSRFQVSRGASATTTVNFGEVGITSSKACFNTKNTNGADISFYFSAANALIVESNLCR